MTADDASLLGGLPIETQAASQSSKAADSISPSKRKALRRGDYHQIQMLQPHAPCAIEKASLAGLLEVVSKGNKWLEYYSYLADDDPCRRGVALSMFAQCMKHAMDYFRQERVKKVLDKTIYEKVKKVVDDIYPSLQVPDGGGRRYSRGFQALGYDDASKDGKEVEGAAKKVYEWLKSDQDPFRAYLAIFSGGGIVYAAQCEEKVMRAYIVGKGASDACFCEDAKKRLCTEEGRKTGKKAHDDHGLTQ